MSSHKNSQKKKSLIKRYNRLLEIMSEPKAEKTHSVVVVGNHSNYILLLVYINARHISIIVFVEDTNCR